MPSRRLPHYSTYLLLRPGNIQARQTVKPPQSPSEKAACVVLFSAKGSQGDVSTSIIVSSQGNSNYACDTRLLLLLLPNSAICRGKARAGAADWMHIFESPPALLAL